MITRNGVYYDLTKSNYRTKINDLTFVFSSRLHLEKFKSRIIENRNKINLSLTKRFNIAVDVSQLADIVLYGKVETRGFLVLNEAGKELCQKNIICGGVKVIEKNLKE